MAFSSAFTLIPYRVRHRDYVFCSQRWEPGLQIYFKISSQYIVFHDTQPYYIFESENALYLLGALWKTLYFNKSKGLKWLLSNDILFRRHHFQSGLVVLKRQPLLLWFLRSSPASAALKSLTLPYTAVQGSLQPPKAISKTFPDPLSTHFLNLFNCLYP